ncbi:MAG: SIS domain-containing protein [Anaerolineae bacterium]|nr:SIS domain-containing protein [Anaerolineae bacterium]
MIRNVVQDFDWGEKSARRAITTLEYLSVNRVIVSGCGDSYHAALASEMAFESIGGVACEPYNGLRLLDYAIDQISAPFPGDPFIVGVSVSGTTARVVSMIERAKTRGHFTVAVTGNAESALATAADRYVSSEIPFIGRSPGIRTYTASLMALYMMAIRIGELQDAYHMDVANAMRKEIAGLADVIEATMKATEGPVKEAVAAFKDSPAMVWLGSGPSYGTALFSAAKLVEGAGLFAIGQDLEEWAHVERFARPNDMPTVIVGPQGKSHWRAVEVAKAAKAVGRRVAVVASKNDKELADLADFVFPVVGDVREEFSPLVYHIASDYMAYYMAEALGRMCFQSDNRALWG